MNEEPITSQSASVLFSSITHDERMSFFGAWIDRQRQSQYIAYDVTSFSSYAKGIENTEWGYNRDGDKLPQINLGCYTGERSGLPMFYVTYPGSIIDKSHLKYMMAYNDELDISNVGFVLDRGFCSSANILYMKSKGFQFIIGVEIRHKTTREAVDKIRENITSMRFRIKQGIYARSVDGCFYGVNSTMHVFYDPELAERQRKDLYRTVESNEEKLAQLENLTKKEVKHFSVFFDINVNKDNSFTYSRNYEKIDRADLNNGFFCILTNTKDISEEILDIYRRKDVIEKNFDDLKNHIDMKRMRTHVSETTEGKIFVSFISLIALSYMGNMTSSIMKEESMSKDSIIMELEKVKTVETQAGKRLINPLTKTVKSILKPFGLDEESLKAYIRNDA